jgi:hypothetical protein
MASDGPDQTRTTPFNMAQREDLRELAGISRARKTGQSGSGERIIQESQTGSHNEARTRGR